MSTHWLNSHDAEALIELATDMAEHIDALADEIDCGDVRIPVDPGLVSRWEVLYAQIDAAGTYPAASDTDAGYWVFTRAQLDRLTAAMDQHAAAIVLQALDSPSARQLGLHILPKARAA